MCCVIFRSCRPKWQPRSCLRRWGSVWGAIVLKVGPCPPTERFMTTEPSSLQRRTNPRGASTGVPGVTPIPGMTGVGLCSQGLQRRIFATKTSILTEDVARRHCVLWRLGRCPGLAAQEREWWVVKLSVNLSSSQHCVQLSQSYRHNEVSISLAVLEKSFTPCVIPAILYTRLFLYTKLENGLMGHFFL